jgi:hypothetical protein
MLDHVSRSKRQPRVRHVQPGRRHQARAESPGTPPRASQLSPPEVLELIERARISRDEVEAELTGLIDQAVGMGIGWPEIAAASE